MICNIFVNYFVYIYSNWSLVINSRLCFGLCQFTNPMP